MTTRAALGCLLATLALLPATLPAQEAPARAEAARVNARIKALQDEAARLAKESRSLVNQVRQLEVERDLRVQELAKAQTAASSARAELETTRQRLEDLERQRVAGLPELKAQLVQIYKRGRSSYLRQLVTVNGLRDFARITRAVSALTFREERLVREHRQTIELLRAERDALDRDTVELQAQERAAQDAQRLAERAVAGRTALIDQIDARRDLTAQYVGELQVAHESLERQFLGPANPAVDAVSTTVPLGPFRGSLEWPAVGALAGRFGQPAPQLGAGLVRNGIEIAAPEGTPVHAIHGGTVSYAGGFTGLGRLVVLDHGSENFSVYGYLDTVGVERGDRVAPGATIGRVGPSPAGPPALYFEMRIDGRFVDPVQWLKPR